MHLVGSMGPGAGKSNLGALTGLIGSGVLSSTHSWSGWGSEPQRKLEVYLRKVPDVLYRDKVLPGAVLGGSDLHRALTANPSYTCRLVGKGLCSTFDIRSCPRIHFKKPVR